MGARADSTCASVSVCQERCHNASHRNLDGVAGWPSWCGAARCGRIPAGGPVSRGGWDWKSKSRLTGRLLEFDGLAASNIHPGFSGGKPANFRELDAAPR